MGLTSGASSVKKKGCVHSAAQNNEKTRKPPASSSVGVLYTVLLTVRRVRRCAVQCR